MAEKIDLFRRALAGATRAIAKDAENLDAAYALINQYLAPPSQDWYAIHRNYWISNQRSIAALPKDVVKSLSLDDPTVMTTAMATQIPDNYDEWLKIWAQIRAA